MGEDLLFVVRPFKLKACQCLQGTNDPHGVVRSLHGFEITGHGLMYTRTYAGDLGLNYKPRKYL